MGLLAKVLDSCVSTKSEWVETVSRFLVILNCLLHFFLSVGMSVQEVVFCVVIRGVGLLRYISMEFILISKPCFLRLVGYGDC